MSPALRALLGFWAVLLGVAGVGAATLQVLGPPPGWHPPPRPGGLAPAAGAAPHAEAAHEPPPAPAAVTAEEHPAAPQAPRQRPPAPEGAAAANHAAGRDQREGAPVLAGEGAAKPDDSVPAPGGEKPVAPVAALLEPAPDFPGASLPRVGPGGQTPMRLYASHPPLPPGLEHAPRVAVLLDGIGLSDLDSREAISALPAAVDLAMSAYAPAPAPLLDAARAVGHEVLASLPMEPQGYPLNDEGVHALLTGATAEANGQNLQWALSRIAGYVGVTGASDGLRGERLAQTTEAFEPVAHALIARGLLYVDPRPGGALPAGLAGRSADLVLDDPPGASELDAKLAQLEAIARERGSALGIAGPPRPVTVARLAGWARTLAERGIALVPVSALVAPVDGRPAEGH